MKRKGVLVLMVLAAMLADGRAAAQTLHLNVQTCASRGWTADSLVANMLVGRGVNVSNVRFNGRQGILGSNAIASFTGGDTCGLGFERGILLTTGNALSVAQENNLRYPLSERPTPLSTVTDSDLQALDTSVSLFDCGVLEFDFVPQTDTVAFRYVFASEEYPDYVCCTYNDKFAFFLSRVGAGGQLDSTRNIAILPGSLPVSINTVNGGSQGQMCDVLSSVCELSNTALYHNNNFYHRPIPFNGYTQVLTASARVTPCVTYHLKICIADVSDSGKDSGVFLEAGSLSAESIKLTLSDGEGSGASATGGEVYETCCRTFVMRRASQREGNDTLMMVAVDSTTARADYRIICLTTGDTILHVSAATPAGTRTYLRIPFPEGVDSLVLQICGLTDTLREATEYFKLVYKMNNDCEFLETPFRLVNVPALAIADISADTGQQSQTMCVYISGGVPPYTYTWTDLTTWQTVSQSSDTQSVTFPFSLNTLHRIRTCVTDACGHTVCDTAVVGPVPRFLRIVRAAGRVCHGDTTTLVAAGAARYAWYRGQRAAGTPLSTTERCVTPPITAPAYFTVVGWVDTLGRSWSNVRTLLVEPVALPTFSIAYTDPDPDRVSTGGTMTISLCNGDSVHLRAAGIAPVAAVTGYRWPGQTAFSPADTFACWPAQAQTYTNYASSHVEVAVRGAAPYYCQNRRTVEIRTFKQPLLSTLSQLQTDTCVGSTVTLAGQGDRSTYGCYYYGWVADTTQKPGTRTPGSGTTGRISRTWTNLASNTNPILAVTGSNKLCVTYYLFHIHVHPLTVRLTLSVDTVCYGDSVTLHGHGAAQYRWPGATAFTADSDYTYLPAAAGRRSLQVTGRTLHPVCSATASQTVEVLPLPTVGITPQSPLLCAGDSVTLTASGTRCSGYRWHWRRAGAGGGWTALGAGGTVCAAPPATAVYRVEAYNTLPGCTAEDSVRAEVLPYPQVRVRTEDSVCAGDTLLLHLSGADEYSVNGGAFSADTVVEVRPMATSRYVVEGRWRRAVGGALWRGCSAFDTAWVFARPLPALTLAAQPQDLCAGDSTTLTAGGADYYRWRRLRAGAWESLTADSGNAVRVVPAATTTYEVEGFRRQGVSRCRNRRETTVRVYPYPALRVMADTGICAGDTLSLHASPASAAGVTYWYTVDGAGGTAYGMGDTARWAVVPTDSALYVVHASAGPASLCQSSDTARVARWPLPAVTAAARPDTVCSGQAVTLTGGGASSYRWTLEGGGWTGQGQTVTAAPTNQMTAAAAYTYRVVGTDSRGCRNSAVQPVVAHSVPAVTLTVDRRTVCTGDEARFTATGARYYSWDTAAWLGPYSAAYTAALPYAAAGAYSPRLYGCNSSTACRGSDTAAVRVLPYPALRVEASDDSVCRGDSVTLRLHGAAQYSVNGSAYAADSVRGFRLQRTTRFVVRGRFADGLCVKADSLTVQVFELPNIVVYPSSATLCAGDSVTLAAFNNNVGGSSRFLWYEAGSSTPLGTGSSSVCTVRPRVTTSYEVVCVQEGGATCRNSRQAAVTVYQPPQLRLMDDTAVCHHASFTLVASAASATPPIRLSCYGDSLYSASTSAASTASAAWQQNARRTGRHLFVVAAATGPDSLCRVTDTVAVTVRPLPAVRLTPDRREICAGGGVTLRAGGAARYNWQSAGGSYNAPDTQRVTPPAGTAVYTLYGEDLYGCRNSDTARVTVHSVPAVTLRTDHGELCTGSTAHLTATGAQHYSWNGGISWEDATPAGTGAASRVVYDSATLCVEGYNSSPLCRGTDSVRVRVYSYPAVRWAADTDQICLHDTVRLTAGGAHEYSFDGGTTWGTDTTTSAVPASAARQTYTVVGRSEGPGCQTRAACYVMVHPLPDLQMAVSREAFCIDSVITISATGGERYRLFSDRDTARPPYGTASAWQRQPDTSTRFYVDCLTHYNCYAQDSHQVTVWTGRFSLYCEDTIVCEHGQVAVSAQGMRYYYWNGSATPDTHNAYIFTVDSTSDFTVYGEDMHGCHGQETMHVAVYPNPRLRLTADTLGVCRGGEVDIAASGASEYVYHWLSPRPTADSVRRVRVEETGSWTVTGIEGSLRCSSTDSIRIEAYPLPPVRLVPLSRDVCEGDTAWLQASGAARYDWYGGAGYTAEAVHADLPAADSLYTVWGEDSVYRCHNYDTASVRWFERPQVTVAADREDLCIGDSTLLRAGGAVFYWWDSLGTATTAASRTVAPDSTTRYRVYGDLRSSRFCGSDATVEVRAHPIPAVAAAADRREICYGDTVRLSGSGAAYYAWLPDTAHTAADSARRLPLRSTTLFRLSGADSARRCYGHDTVGVTVYDPRVWLTPQAWEICNGGTLEVSAAGADRYRWTDTSQFTDSASHTYRFENLTARSRQTFLHVAGETANRLCRHDTTISIVVYPRPAIRLVIEDHDSTGLRTWEICAGDSVRFFASGGYYYQFVGQDSVSRAVRHVYRPQTAGPDTLVCCLYGENFNHQCSGADSLLLIVNPLPPVALAASRSEVCEGDTVRLTATGGIRYRPDGGAEGADSSWVVRVDSTTLYRVSGADSKRCRAADSVRVTAFPVPQVTLHAEADSLCRGFATRVAAHGGTRYAWGDDTLFAADSVVTVAPQHDTVIRVRGNNFNGMCVGGDSLRIVVLDPPPLAVTATPPAICWGDTATLAVRTTECCWQWDGGACVSDPLRVSPHDSTLYRVAVQAANGCWTHDSVLVEVRPFEHVRLSGDGYVCRGDSVRLTASGSARYDWDGLGAFGTDSVRSFAPLADTLITVRGTARDSLCRSTDTLRVRVQAPPTLYVDPETVAVCLGDSIVITASGCDQYRWMEDTSAGWHNGYHLLMPAEADTFAYIVTGSRAGGVCVTTAAVAVAVADTPHVQIAGLLDICLGDSVRLTASGADTYGWEGGPLSPSGRFATRPDSAGCYTYRVTAAKGSLSCRGGFSQQVRVHPVPAVALVLSDTVLCFGDTVRLTASGAALYSWDTGATYSPQALFADVAARSRSYTLYGTDTMRLCADTATAWLRVNPQPSVALTALQPDRCYGDSLALLAAGAEAYRWDDGSGDTLRHVLCRADIHFSVVGSDANGCRDTASIEVAVAAAYDTAAGRPGRPVVHRYPSVTAASDRPEGICLGDSVTLSCAGAQRYDWIDYGHLGDTLFTDHPDTTRAYTVVGTMPWGCPDTAAVRVPVFYYPAVRLSASDTALCDSALLRLSATGAERYSWDGGRTFDTLARHECRPPTGDTLFRVVGATANLLCRAEDSVCVATYAYPRMTIHGAERWCEGSEVVLTVENPPDTLRWESLPPDPSLAGQEGGDTLHLHPQADTRYRLTGIRRVCATTAEHAVAMVPYPVLVLEGQPRQVCAGDSVTLTATGAERYSWDGGLSYTADSAFWTAPAASGFLRVAGTTYDTLCSAEDSLYIHVDTLPLLAITGTDSGCVGRWVELEAHSEVPAVWSSEPYDHALDTQSTAAIIRVSPSANVRYSLSGSNGACTDTVYHMVEVGTVPKADATITPSTVRRGEGAEVHLYNRSTGNDGYVWIMPDSSRLYEHDPWFVVPLDYYLDTFTVTLIAYLGGCHDTARVSLTVLSDEIFAPNIFTPTQETNNRFYPPFHNKENFYVEIFNRQGLKVYESADPYEGWDGRYKGWLCPTGTYVYRIRTSPTYSKETNYTTGTVTLLR